MRRLFIMVIAAISVIGFAVPSWATVTGGDTYGPAGMSGADNGSCGNEWANDTWQRSFNVNPTPRIHAGVYSYNVTRWDRSGAFTTIAGVSPGACDSGTDNGNTVIGGINGKFYGHVNYTVTCPSTGDCYNRAAATQYMSGCSPNCTTDGFVAAAFGPGATYTSGAFVYTYRSSDRRLCLHKWVDQGYDGTSETFTGDIATTCH
jgi:hypothetical protein